MRTTTARVAEAKPPRIEGGLRRRGVHKRGLRERGDQGGEPLVSVVLPSRNPDPAELRRALRSVLGQTWPNVELLVLDAASDNGTVDLLRDHDDAIDYWHSAPDRGRYDAMNQGAALAAGDWIYFMGADDVLVDVLHRVVPHFRDPRTVVYGDVYMASRNRLYDGPFPWHKLRFKNVCHQAVFYPRAVFERYRYAFEKYPICGDYDLNLKLWSDGSFRTRYLPELIALFGVGDSATVTDEAFERDREALVEAAFGDRIRRRERWMAWRHRLGRLLPGPLREAVGQRLPAARRKALNPPWPREKGRPSS